MSADFYWSLKKNIDAELYSLSCALSDLTDNDLTDQNYSRLSRQCDHIQNLFDQISVVSRDLDMVQSNPELYALLEANQQLNENYGKFHRMRNNLFSRFAKRRNSREEEPVRERSEIEEQVEEPTQEQEVETPEIQDEEEIWIEEDELDPDAKKKANQAARKAHQDKLKQYYSRQDLRRAEEQRRVEEQRRADERRLEEERIRAVQLQSRDEAARLGMFVQPDQVFTDADLQRERIRQDDERVRQQILAEQRLQNEKDAIRRTNEKLERSEQFEGIGNSHIDMSWDTNASDIKEQARFEPYPIPESPVRETERLTEDRYPETVPITDFSDSYKGDFTSRPESAYKENNSFTPDLEHSPNYFPSERPEDYVRNDYDYGTYQPSNTIPNTEPPTDNRRYQSPYEVPVQSYEPEKTPFEPTPYQQPYNSISDSDRYQGFPEPRQDSSHYGQDPYIPSTHIVESSQPAREQEHYISPLSESPHSPVNQYTVSDLSGNSYIPADTSSGRNAEILSPNLTPNQPVYPENAPYEDISRVSPYQNVSDNAQLYASLLLDKKEAEPVTVPLAFQQQLYQNMHNAYSELAKAIDTEREADAREEFLRQREYVFQYQNDIQKGTVSLSDPQTSSYSPWSNQQFNFSSPASDAQTVVSCFTPDGTVSERIVNCVPTGTYSVSSTPDLDGKPVYSADNPMVVTPEYEQAIISKMELAKESLQHLVDNSREKATVMDPVQAKMYEDAYFAFENAKKKGTVVVSSSSNGTKTPDYEAWAWERTHYAQNGNPPGTGGGGNFGGDGGGTPFSSATGQQKEQVIPNTTGKHVVSETAANIFNQGNQLKQKSILSVYASKLGYRYQRWATKGANAFVYGMYGIMQSGEENALHTFEEGRRYITTAAGVVIAIQSGFPTNAMQKHVAHASSKEFQLFGTRTLMTDKELSQSVRSGVAKIQNLNGKISELEVQLAPFYEKMESYVLAHPGANKLDGLDESLKSEFEKLSNQLNNLRGKKHALTKNVSLNAQMQALRKDAKLEAEALEKIKKHNKHMPKTAKGLEKAVERINKHTLFEMEEKFGKKLVKLSDEELLERITIKRQQGKELRAQIRRLQAKGANISPADKALLEKLKKRAKEHSKETFKFIELQRARAELAAINGKFDSMINAAKNNASRLLGGANVLKSFMLRGLQAGAESGTDGIAKVIEISTNPIVHKIVKVSYKAAVLASKASLNLIAPGSAEAISQAVSFAVTGVKANVGVAVNTATTAIKAGVKVGLKTAGQAISTAVPTGIKTGIQSGINTVTAFNRNINGRFQLLRAGLDKVKNRVAGSVIGRAFSAVSRGATAVREALKAALKLLKGVIIKAGLVFLGVFLLIGILTAAFGMLAGGVGGSTIAAAESSADGKIDLSPYVAVIMEEEKAFQAEIDALVNDPKYDKVSVNYAGAVNNTKQILSMMAVRLEQDLDIEVNPEVSAYIRSLYKDSHTYITSKRSYTCSGDCPDSIVITVPKTTIDPNTGEKVFVYERNKETGEREMVMVSKKVCPGHTDLTITVSVLTFDDIYRADSSAAGSISLVGNETKEKVWNYLKERGLEDIQAAAIMGNIQAESGFDPSILERGNGIGFGLCQWSYGRRTQFERYAKSRGLSPSDLGVQLDFFWSEFSPAANSSFSDFQWIHPRYTYQSFMATDSIEEATRIFCFGWERPSAKHSHINTRIHSSLTYYNLYAGTDASDYETPEKDTETDPSKPKVFEWNDENREWCETIYNMPWGQLYSGVHDYGGVIESGELIVYGDYMWPVSSTNITSEFGYRTAPTEGASTYHKGVDIGIPVGTPVHAVADGVVTTSTSGSSTGKFIVIDHGDGIKTRYLHNSVLCFNKGDTVKQGDVIAYSGNTGVSTGPHLHFEFIVNGTPIDPCVQFGIN